MAVVTERNLDWMASVLAVLRAGGTYLPIEPQFPAERIAAMLRRVGLPAGAHRAGPHGHARPGLAASAPASASSTSTTVDQAGRSAPIAGRRGRVRPAGLHLYFTSGSTGEPKGALCEHAGMLNHLLREGPRPRPPRGRGGRADRAAVLRHLPVAAGRGAARRGAHGAGRPGRDPRRRPVPRHAGRRTGSRCSRSCRPTSTSCSPGWRPSRATCPTCAASRSPARRCPASWSDAGSPRGPASRSSTPTD